ncbi:MULTISPECIES: hypothetical protein [unclassified Isoptericola]|uniref:hypothetical protein n=1 Tax=unclassified Isoptericola TaxID=2623355 RepID=UPI0036481E64
MTTLAHRAARGILLAGAAGALALLVTACASGDGAGGEATSASPSSPESATESSPASPEPTSPEPSGTATSEPATPAELAPGEHTRGLPEGAEGTMDSPAGAAWSPTPGVLLVVTYGSSTCPLLAEAEGTWDSSGGTAVVTFEKLPDGPCTMDYMPTTSAVALPAGADEGAPVAVRLGDRGTVEVAPRGGEGETGPVAWVPAKG